MITDAILQNSLNLSFNAPKLREFPGGKLPEELGHICYTKPTATARQKRIYKAISGKFRRRRKPYTVLDVLAEMQNQKVRRKDQIYVVTKHLWYVFPDQFLAFLHIEVDEIFLNWDNNAGSKRLALQALRARPEIEVWGKKVPAVYKHVLRRIKGE